MSKNFVDTLCLKLLKIATKVVNTGRYVKFKLCSGYPYKEEVIENFRNIWNLAVQIERKTGTLTQKNENYYHMDSLPLFLGFLMVK